MGRTIEHVASALPEPPSPAILPSDALAGGEVEMSHGWESSHGASAVAPVASGESAAPHGPDFAEAMRGGSVADIALAVSSADAFIRDELMRQVHERFGNAVAVQVIEAMTNPMAFAAATTHRPAPLDFAARAKQPVRGAEASTVDAVPADAVPRAAEPAVAPSVHDDDDWSSKLWPVDGERAADDAVLDEILDTIPGEKIAEVLFANPFTLRRDVARVAYGPIFDRLRRRDAVRKMTGTDKSDPVSEGIGNVLGDLADDPAFAGAFAIGAGVGGYHASRDFVYAPVALVHQVFDLLKVHFLEGDLAVLKKAVAAVDAFIQGAPKAAAWFADQWNGPDSLARGKFQGKVTGYCVMTLALAIASAYEGPLAVAGEYKIAFDIIKRVDMLGDVTSLVPGLRGAKAGKVDDVVEHLPHVKGGAEPHVSAGATESPAPSGVGRAAEHDPPQTIGDIARGATPSGDSAARGVAREADELPARRLEVDGPAAGRANADTAGAVQALELPGLAPESSIGTAIRQLATKGAHEVVRFVTTTAELLAAAAHGVIRLPEYVIEALRSLARKTPHGHGPMLALPGGGMVPGDWRMAVDVIAAQPLHGKHQVEGAAATVMYAERLGADLVPGSRPGGDLAKSLGDGPEAAGGMHVIDGKDDADRMRHATAAAEHSNQGARTALAEHIPPAGPEFVQWWDSLTLAELDNFLRDRNTGGLTGAKAVIDANIRHPGGLHEWLMVKHQRQIKRWGVSLQTVLDARTSTEATIGRHFKHGSSGSGRMHAQLDDLIETSPSFDAFKHRLNEWADVELFPVHGPKGEPPAGRFYLPPDLQVK